MVNRNLWREEGNWRGERKAGIWGDERRRFGRGKRKQRGRVGTRGWREQRVSLPQAWTLCSSSSLRVLFLLQKIGSGKVEVGERVGVSRIVAFPIKREKEKSEPLLQCRLLYFHFCLVFTGCCIRLLLIFLGLNPGLDFYY